MVYNLNTKLKSLVSLDEIWQKGQTTPTQLTVVGDYQNRPGLTSNHKEGIHKLRLQAWGGDHPNVNDTT